MDSRDLDKISLTGSQRTKGIAFLVFFSALGLFLCFGNVTVGGSSTNAFGAVYNGFINLFGGAIWWIILIIILGNLGAHVYFRYIKKGQVQNAFADVYNHDGWVKTCLYVLGSIYAVTWTLFVSLGMDMPEIIVGDATGGNVFPPIVKGVFGIILMGAVCMPFLLNYGLLEIIGAILEPIMRPLFKTPGKAALDATSSFVSSSSLGVLITNRLWKNKIYTEKECVAIMTGFSAVSIGFAYLVIDTAGCSSQWAKIYAISFVMVFLIEMILVRVWPINKKKDVYIDGTVQTPDMRKNEARYSLQTLPRGVMRGVKRAGISKGPVRDIWDSVRDSVLVLPQVLTMLSAIGLTGMILAEYTPIFDIIGYAFRPLMMVLQVPDIEAIASSMPVGIAEMFLPVLVMAGKTVEISFQAKVYVCLVSMCQIIFFSETGTVMLATRSPVKFWELCVLFLWRTLIAMVFAAIAIHIFF
ncbi:MAG: YjiH family protein [Firmicutes bacterium]|nr:YjiH family protein [Bacillota bacterium]